MPPNHFESEVESFLEGSHGDRTHIKRADHPRLHHYAGHYCSARPRRRPPALRQVPLAPFTPVVPGVLMCGSVRRLEARPGPAATQ